MHYVIYLIRRNVKNTHSGTLTTHVRLLQATSKPEPVLLRLPLVQKLYSPRTPWFDSYVPSKTTSSHHLAQQSLGKGITKKDGFIHF